MNDAWCLLRVQLAYALLPCGVLQALLLPYVPKRYDERLALLPNGLFE